MELTKLFQKHNTEHVYNNFPSLAQKCSPNLTGTSENNSLGNFNQFINR